MSTARSVFTEAIEDHLALKKQNIALEGAMPLARYDVGDPLDRYPGGAHRAEGTVVVAEGVLADAESSVMESAPAQTPTSPTTSQATQLMAGPSPEQAMEAATALEPAFADRPFEPLNGMTPMLSLVEDIDEDDEHDVASAASAIAAAPSAAGDVLRFPGGVGPRDDASEPMPPLDGQLSVELDAGMNDLMPTSTIDPTAAVATASASAPTATAVAHDAPTGEQPVLVIDTDEPLATSDIAEPATPSRATRRKPRFFGLGRKRNQGDAPADGWFTDGPRDFNWD